MERRPIDPQVLRAALPHRWVRVDVVDEVESTNAVLMADTEAPAGSVVVAEHQTSGRGRLDRSWSSPPRAGLTFSVLLRPSVPIATWGWLPLLTGVALRDAVVAVTGLDVVLKWPNDLLDGASERKLAGILAQTSGEAVVIGIGLNVTTAEDELPVPTATSLALCGAASLDRSALLVEILAGLDRRLVQWSSADGDAESSGLADAYRAACATLGRAASVTTTSGEAFVGTAVGIDPDGRLLLDANGTIHPIGAGDVEHLRAAD